MSSVEEDYIVVGAGPAGAAAAYTLSKHGFRVSVYEAMPYPAVKPCGWGVPLHRHLPLAIPEERILEHIDGAILYVDGSHALDYTGNDLGVIIDKQGFISDLLDNNGVKVYYRTPMAKSMLSRLDTAKTILATGFSFYKGETINAVQLHLKTETSWNNVFEFNFSSSIIGYYWIFPLSRHEVKVGVGGFADIPILRKLLEKFIRNDKRIRYGVRTTPLTGAKLAVGGINTDGRVPYKIGESIGAVYPLTGEGIRPSMVTGIELAEALSRGKDPFKAIKKSSVYWKINLQRSILEKVKRLSENRRAEFLRNLDPEVLIKIGLGDFSRTSLLKLALKSPKGLAELIKSFITR